MKKPFLLFLMTTALVACTTPGKPNKGVVADSPCGENTRGTTDGKLTYRVKNEFEMSIRLNFEVGSSSEMTLRLDPKVDSHDAVIKIIGVSGTLPGGAPTDFTWLNKSGKAADFPRRTIVFCVPEVPLETEYKFDVEVGGIGKLDPRIDVTY